MYCGNNRNNPDVVSGEKKIGTRYDCFRRGIGVGKNLPFDPSYAVPYDPIDTFTVYCGKNKQLPSGYDKMGSLPQCLRKGIGVGKSIQSKKGKTKGKKTKKKKRKKSSRK